MSDTHATQNCQQSKAPLFHAFPLEMQQSLYWVGWHFKDQTKTAMRAFHFAGRENVFKSDVLWGSLAEAQHAANSPLYVDGIGFAFSPIDSFCGIELNNCRDPASGVISEHAREIVKAVDSYTELSPCEQGLHVFLKASVRDHIVRTCGLKLYSMHKFFPVTGRVFESHNFLHDRTDSVIDLWSKMMKKEIDEARTRLVLPPWQQPDTRIPKDDRILLETARLADRNFKLDQLWQDKKFRHGAGRANKDFSLCLKLAYWCGPDVPRIDRLFRSSKSMNDRWEKIIGTQGKTYGRMLVEGAVNYQQRFGFHRWI